MGIVSFDKCSIKLLLKIYVYAIKIYIYMYLERERNLVGRIYYLIILYYFFFILLFLRNKCIITYISLERQVF